MVFLDMSEDSVKGRHSLGRMCGIIRCTVGNTTHIHEGLMIFDGIWPLSFE